MFLRKTFLLISICLTLVVGNGCAKKQVVSIVTPSDTEVGQIIEIRTFEKLPLEIYEKAEVEVATNIISNRLTIEVVDKDLLRIKGKLEEVYDSSADLFIVNKKEDHIVEIEFEDIDFIRIESFVWSKPKLSWRSGRLIELLILIAAAAQVL